MAVWYLFLLSDTEGPSFINSTAQRFRVFLTQLLQPQLTGVHSEDLPGQLYDIYKAMKVAHEQGRDSIWKFILQNSYKPVFLMNCFDFVVGNPPWLTYSGVSNGEYQALLKQLSDSYGVTPSQTNMPHLEIAAIFLAHSVNYFLKSSGQLSFVMPRSFISADQHENTRQGLIEGVKLSKVWDLEGVAPLFRVPSCVLFALQTSEKHPARSVPAKGLPGLSFSGHLPRSQIHWNDATSMIDQRTRRWYYSRLLKSGRGGARSALTAEARDGLVGTNAYASRFTQGATIVQCLSGCHPHPLDVVIAQSTVQLPLSKGSYK